MIRSLTRCLAHNHQHNLDVRLGKILFVYILKMDKERTYFPSPLKRSQSLVLNFHDRNKGWENKYIKVTRDQEFDSRDEKLWDISRICGQLIRCFPFIKYSTSSFYFFKIEQYTNKLVGCSEQHGHFCYLISNECVKVLVEALKKSRREDACFLRRKLINRALGHFPPTNSTNFEN